MFYFNIQITLHERFTDVFSLLVWFNLNNLPKNKKNLVNIVTATQWF